VPQAVGAPLRTVTVRDAIGDLPPIANGAAQVELPYAGARARALGHAGAAALLLAGTCQAVVGGRLQQLCCVVEGDFVGTVRSQCNVKRLALLV